MRIAAQYPRAFLVSSLVFPHSLLTFPCFFFFFLFFWGYHLLTRVPLSFSFFFACFFLGPFVLLLFQRLVGKKVECASFLRTFLQQPLESLTPVSNPFPHHKQLTHTHTVHANQTLSAPLASRRDKNHPLHARTHTNSTHTHSIRCAHPFLFGRTHIFFFLLLTGVLPAPNLPAAEGGAPV